MTEPMNNKSGSEHHLLCNSSPKHPIGASGGSCSCRVVHNSEWRDLQKLCEEQRVEIAELKKKPKILVADHEVSLSIFKDIVRSVGKAWAYQTFTQYKPDVIFGSAILEWQMDEDGLFSITASGKKVRMSDSIPSVKLVIVKRGQHER